MTKEKVRVVIDDREAEEILPYFENHDEVEDWYIDRLEIGDIQIEEADFLAERKTMGDYSGSLTSGHLTDQIRRMKEVSDNCYILLEGNMSDTEFLPHSNLPSTAIRGHMASTMARQGVPVVLCSNKKYLVDMAVRLGRKYIESPGSAHLDIGDIDKTAPTTMRMYGCIDGVGPEMAKRLYEEYPTMIDLSRTTKSKLKMLEGIGDTLAVQILEEISQP